MYREGATVLKPEPEEGFVETAQIKKITERAQAYLGAGFPVHFSGPTGVGKTTLATHLAYKIGRPVIFIFGDEEFGTSDLVGAEYGYHKRSLVDRFIPTVVKKEEDFRLRWVDNRLTTACKHGLTLIYDEFNRSRPEANNVLLSILEEHILPLPSLGDEEGYLQVHSNFKAIFTSNPEEYAGVHRAQDALRDRMVTMNLDHFNRPTEIAITMARAGIPAREAEKIVNIIRGLRKSGEYRFTPTIRAAIIIGKVTRLRGARIKSQNRIFKEICVDVLTSETNGLGAPPSQKSKTASAVRKLIKQYT
jgi:gas vesicle protein GvpN